MSHQTDDRRRRRRSDDDPATHGAIASSAITCPSARPATCPTCQTRTALSAQQVQHACTTFNRLLGDFFTRKFIQADSDRRLFVYFLCFLFSLPLPSFLKPLVLLSLSLSLPQLGWTWSELLSSTAWIRRTGPVRSTLPAIDFRDVHRQLQKRRFPLSIPENLNPLYGKIDLYDDV